MSYPHNGRPVKPSAFDKLFTLNVSPTVSAALLFAAVFAALACLAAMQGCQWSVHEKPAASAVPEIKAAAVSVETAKIETAKTAVSLTKAQAAPALPECKAAVTEAQGSNAKADAALTIAAPALAKAEPLAVKHEKNEAAAIAKVEELQSEDDKETKLWLRIGAVIALMAGGALAYAMFKAGSIFRAIGFAASGVVVSVGLFWAASHLALIWQIVGWTLAVSALVGISALAAHFWKHAKASDNALWALGNAAESATIGGAKGVLNTADAGFHDWLKATLTDAEYAKATKYLPK